MTFHVYTQMFGGKRSGEIEYIDDIQLMAERKFGAFSSSSDPTKLALTVKGVLIALIPVIISLAQSFGWEVAESELAQFIEQAGMITAGFTVLYGLGRKWFNSKKVE